MSKADQRKGPLIRYPRRTQDELYAKSKFKQITPSTLVIGIDIAKGKHVARDQDDRGFEFGKRLIFENRIHGFELLLEWAERHAKENEKGHIIFGVEPTGHSLPIIQHLKPCIIITRNALITVKDTAVPDCFVL